MAAAPRTVVGHTLSVVRKGNFWVWILFGVTLVILLWGRKMISGGAFTCYSFDITERNLPHVILFWALTATAIYTYFFLLIATISKSEKTFLPGTAISFWFHVLFYATALFAIYVAFLNFTSLFHLDCAPPPGASSNTRPQISAASVGSLDWLTNLAGSFFGGAAELFRTFDLLVLVISWSSLDLMIAWGGRDTEEREFFRSIFCIVDLPVISSMIFVECITHFCLDGISAMYIDYLRAGVVAFQLIAAGVAICMLEGMRQTPETVPIGPEAVAPNTQIG